MRIRSAAVVLGLFLVLAVYSLLQMYERRETIVDLGPGKAARQNPFLAAERFLEEMGVDASAGSDYSRVEALGAGDALLVTSSDLVQGEKRTRDILEWVRGGGHLIMAPGEGAGNQRWLPDHTGVSVLQTEHDGVDHDACHEWLWRKNRARTTITEVDDLPEARRSDNPASHEDRIPPFCRDNGYLTEVRFQDYPDTLLVNLHAEHLFETDFSGQGTASDSGISRPGIEFSGAYSARDKRGASFVQRKLGNGLVSLVANAGLWTNRQIGDFDNALLLAVLTGSHQTLVILHGSSMPPLTTLIWRHGREFVVVAAVLLLLWLWSAGLRRGPLHAPAVTTRREILEHITARADYYWRTRSFDALLRPLREEIDYHGRIRLPNYIQCDRDERARLIAEYCDVPVERVSELFTDGAVHDQTACEQAIRLARHIRKQL